MFKRKFTRKGEKKSWFQLWVYIWMFPPQSCIEEVYNVNESKYFKSKPFFLCIYDFIVWIVVALFYCLLINIVNAWQTQIVKIVAERVAQHDWQGRVLQADRVVLMELFANWCGHYKSLAPQWEKVRTALKGIVTVGAVDADTHCGLAQVTCWSFTIFKFLYCLQSLKAS